MEQIRTRQLSLHHLIFYVAVILVLSNLTLITILPNIILNSLFIVVLSIIQYIAAKRNGIIFFTTLVAMLSNFTYGNNQCGLYNVSTFLAIFYMLLLGNDSWKPRLKTPKAFLVIILLFLNIAGYIIHPEDSFAISQGFMTMVAFVMMFLLTSKAQWDFYNVGFFLKGLLLVQVYSLVVNLFKITGYYSLSLPMFGGSERIGSQTQAGVMGNSELFAELSLVLVTCLTFLFLYDELKKKCGFTTRALIFFFLVVSANMFFGRSRSVLVLYVIVFIFILVFSVRSKSRINVKNLRVLFLASILFIVLIGPFINIEYSLSEFNDSSTLKLNSNSLLQGSGLNRENVFPLAMKRLSDDPWIIGYGWGNTERNRVAWDLTNYPDIADYHSLYFSLPMIFGWTGTIILIVLLFSIARNLLSLRKNISVSPNNLVLNQLLFLVIVVIIINQFKISALRDPNYFMIIWILLGIGNSISAVKLSQSTFNVRLVRLSKQRNIKITQTSI